MKTPLTLPFVLLGAVCLATNGRADSQPSPVQHDPFSRPAVERASVAPGDAMLDQQVAQAKLKGVLITDALHLANIDGQVLAAGDAIYGYRVVTIGERTVTLQRGNEVLTMELNGVDVDHGDRD